MNSTGDVPHFPFFCGKKLWIALVSFLIITPELYAQTRLGPFVLRPRLENPLFPPLSFPAHPAPVLADLDGDGDKDLIVGASHQDYGTAIRYYENAGTETAPFFDEREGSENPFSYLIYDYLVPFRYISPTLGDLDDDGDLDLLTGFATGELRYYRNNGDLDFEEQSGPWDPATALGNPFHGVIPGYYSYPHFTDHDGDGDLDVLVGANAESTHNSTVHLFVNDGLANFTHALLPDVNPPGQRITITTVDFNGDGDNDIISGSDDGLFRYFERNADGSYSEQPAEALNVLGFGPYASAFFSDLNNNGMTDAVVGNDLSSSSQTLTYLENTGGNNFEIRAGMHTPFGGVDIALYALPVFDDTDGDGDSDALISSSDNRISLFFNNAGVFTRATDAENPFASITTADDFSLSYVDVDGDGQKDIVGGSNAGIQYFRSTSGAFAAVPNGESPFAGIVVNGLPRTDLGDIDGDGDYDLLVGDEIIDDPSTEPIEWGVTVRFFENTGTAQSPAFTERTGAANPFGSVNEEYTLTPRLADVDHDGGIDALFAEGGPLHIEAPESNEFLYFENTGPADFEFTLRGNLVPQYENAEYFAPAFFDYDDDGDLDIFEGDQAGVLHLYRNENPPATVTLDAAPLDVIESSGSVLIDPALTLTDADNDSIARVIIAITPFTETDTLEFTWPASDGSISVTAEFSDATGSLTLSGKAPLDWYQQLLRTLKYGFANGSPSLAARAAVSTASSSRVITIAAFDADFTAPVTASRTINTTTANQPPVFADASVSVAAGKRATVNLRTLISDPDGAGDINESSLRTVSTPGSGADVSITPDLTLQVDYSSLSFTGTDNVALEVCDNSGACAQNDITITVSNIAPVFNDASVEVAAGKSMTFELLTLVADDDDNVVPGTIEITGPPVNGTATVSGQQTLSLDYSGSMFTGTEFLVLKVCDIVGACDFARIDVRVKNSPPAISAFRREVAVHSVAEIPLPELISDDDDNLDLSTLRIAGGPASGAVASVNENFSLVVDYSAVAFAGLDDIVIEVCDVANACGVNVITIDVLNAAPVFSPAIADVRFGRSATIDLTALVSDPDANIGPAPFNIVEGPQSGAAAVITAENQLVVNYSSVAFFGTDEILLEVCDRAGYCSRSVVTINVLNDSPVISPASFSTVYPGPVTVDLIAITSDIDDNLDLSAFAVVGTASGAATAIDAGVLRIDYVSVMFTGTDELRLRACDLAGACTENVITVLVTEPAEDEIRIYNAVAPKGQAENRWMRIENLPEGSRVTIFNRWGDKVFATDNYDSQTEGRRFEGLNENGRELPSGTYFYKIDFANSSKKSLTGFLYLIQ